LYAHTKYEVPLTVGTATLDLTSTGDKARWSPGFTPHIIRAVAIQLNATPGDAGVVKGDIRQGFGSDAVGTRGDGDAFVVNLATTHTVTAGSIPRTIYKEVNVVIKPGQELVIEVTDASASVSAAKMVLMVEPTWERPANVTPTTTMVAST
jgi:hypothetical protein